MTKAKLSRYMPSRHGLDRGKGIALPTLDPGAIRGWVGSPNPGHFKPEKETGKLSCRRPNVSGGQFVWVRKISPHRRWNPAPSSLLLVAVASTRSLPSYVCCYYYYYYYYYTPFLFNVDDTFLYFFHFVPLLFSTSFSFHVSQN